MNLILSKLNQLEAKIEGGVINKSIIDELC